MTVADVFFEAIRNSAQTGSSRRQFGHETLCCVCPPSGKLFVDAYVRDEGDCVEKVPLELPFNI